MNDRSWPFLELLMKSRWKRASRKEVVLGHERLKLVFHDKI